VGGTATSFGTHFLLFFAFLHAFFAPATFLPLGRGDGADVADVWLAGVGDAAATGPHTAMASRMVTNPRNTISGLSQNEALTPSPKCLPLNPSDLRHAAIDEKLDAVDEAAVVGCEEHNRFSDFVRDTDAAEWNRRGHGGHEALDLFFR